MKLSQKQVVIIGFIGIIIFIGIVLFFFGLRSSKTTLSVTLKVWGTDPSAVFQNINVPGVTVLYTQIDPAQYENQLLTALAAGNGPDVFEIGNHEVPKWKSILAPLPAQLASTFSVATMANDFPSVVQTDFAPNGQIDALPLDLDTLAMFYNKDIFDSAGIVYPPKTWDDLEADIPSLRILNSQGQITQAAVAMGGSETTIANAPDLVFLLMLQNGTQMTSSDDSEATFDSGGGTGLAALNFYLQFADASSPYYTWNDGMGDALQSFIQGKTAILFGYDSTLSEIQSKAPFLNVGVAPMLQPADAVLSINYPEYTGLAVAKKGQVAAAWQFIIDLTTSPTLSAEYANATGEPPANRAVIASDLKNPSALPFIAQTLTARSWYEADDEQIDGIMNSTIQSVLTGSVTAARGLSEAQDAVSALMNTH